MSNKTIKHIWPVSLMMSLAIIGVIAAFVVLAAVPRGASADGGAPHSCAGMTASEIAIHNAVDTQLNGGRGQCLAPGTTPMPGTTPTPGTGQDVFAITSSSTSASSTVELKVEIANLSTGLPVGSSIELYLEDDYQVPDLITSGAAYFVVTNTANADARLRTGSGAPVLSLSPVIVQTDDHFAGDDDYAIQVVIPDLCTSSNQAGQGTCDGQNGPEAGQTLTLVLTRAAGIKNPTEEKNYKVGAQILPLITDTQPNSGPNAASADTLSVLAKITLSDDDNKRGYELSVLGKGFNDGTTADAYVYTGGSISEWWDLLDCAQMVAAVDDSRDANMDNPYCKMYANLGDTEKMEVRKVDYKTGDAGRLVCEEIVKKGTLLGGALVGSDDLAAVMVEVTAPTFQPGDINAICMVDGENRHSKTWDDFNLEPSIRAVPDTVSSGDTVNIFAQDYPISGGFSSLKLSGIEVWNNLPTMINGEANPASRKNVKKLRPAGLVNGAAEVSFEVPGSVGGAPLQGTVRVDGRWGPLNADGKCVVADGCTTKNTKITVTGSELTASVTDVLPNETITINGNGYGVQTCIYVDQIQLSSVAVEVDEESTAGRCARSNADGSVTPGVEVSNSGQFVATITLWPTAGTSSNPTLVAGSHKLEAEDNQGYVGSTMLTIPAPTIDVVPNVVGPRDYVVITGTNWPVDNADNSNAGLVEVTISDNPVRDRTYSVYADNSGRFTIEHRVSKDVPIPSTNQVKGSYSDVVEVGSFMVPAATVTVTPGSAQPGDLISLSATDLKPYAEADYVKVGGTAYNDPGANTDIDGNITIDDVLVPGLDPGTYSVIINVDGTVAIGELKVLAEDSAAGAGAELPGALEGLDNNLLRVFHFNDVNKSWDFYDPRDEFAEFNTLTTLVNGEPYWVLVSESQEDVVLNNRARTFTCVGGDCWNQIVW